jgi:hypothetical protein
MIHALTHARTHTYTQRTLSDSLVNLRNAVLAVPPLPPHPPGLTHNPAAIASAERGAGPGAGGGGVEAGGVGAVVGAGGRPAAPWRILHAIISSAE